MDYKITPRIKMVQGLKFNSHERRRPILVHFCQVATISLTNRETVFFDVRPLAVTSSSSPLPGEAERGAFKTTEKKLVRRWRTVMLERRRCWTDFKRSLALISNVSFGPLLCIKNVTRLLRPAGIV